LSAIEEMDRLKNVERLEKNLNAIQNIISSFHTYQEQQMELFKDYQRAEQHIKQKTVLRNIIREADMRFSQIKRKIED